MMLRGWAVLLSLLVTVSLGAGGLTKGWQKVVVGGATVAMLYSGTELMADPDGWLRIRGGRQNAIRHQAASFYLVIDFGEAWRTMHVQYIGNNDDGTPLVVGSRRYIIGTLEDNRVVLENARISMVGVDGLIAEDLDVQEVANLLNPTGAGFSLTVLSIDGVDLGEIEPVIVADGYPEINTELEIISYRADLANNLLGFFAYPAMRRDCLAGNFFSDKWLALSTCTVPTTPASVGSPLFIKESGELIGFNYGTIEDITVEIDGELHAIGGSIVVPPFLRKFTDGEWAVNPQDKTTISWAEIKHR